MLMLRCCFFVGVLLLSTLFANQEKETAYAAIQKRVDYGYNNKITAAIITPENKEFIGAGASPFALFEIGSITKFFTAHLALILEEKGALSLDDPLSKHLLNRNLPQWLAKKTVYQILTHTAGIEDPDRGNYYNPRNANTVAVADYNVDAVFAYLKRCEDKGPLPRYSNLGYALLGHLLERVTGLSYHELLKRHITDPMQLDHTWVALPPEHASQLLSGHSCGVKKPRWHCQLPAFASIISNLNDMSRYFSQIIFGPLSESNIAKRLRETPFTLPGFAVQTGLGWSLDSRFTRPFYAIAGRTLGHSSFVGFDPTRRLAYVVLADSDSIGKLPWHLLDHTIADDALEKAVKVDLETLKKWEGRYQTANENRLTFSIYARDGYLELVEEGAAPDYLFPSMQGDFFSKWLEGENHRVVLEEEDNICLHIVTKEQKKLFATKVRQCN